ncbi:hypothetical protein BJ878DRAFT_535134 [Calycina marina]|uniref:RNA-binding protein n=1 Tax=Calycina marina TaxID=1763456 RepID=A0A9P7Z2B5_9HELO|nr:hypothetical protein BJ878DRAFT_535134 [Calycina marina]
MYDDEPYSNKGEHGSQGYQNFGKDTQISPQGGSADYSRDDNYKRHDRHERSQSPRREGQGRYRDRDQEGYSSPRRRSRTRSRSPYFGAPPNRTVILEALPINMTQEDILNELQRRLHIEGIEEVRLIKDKRSGLSRQFAFVQFVGVSEAKSFLGQYFPTVSLYGSYDPAAINDHGPARVRIAFSREKDDRSQPGRNEDDWKCDVCFLTNYSNRVMCHRCNAPRTRSSTHGLMIAQTNMSSFSGFATTGDSDAAPDNAPSQFLLVRGLDPGINEEILSKGINKLYKSKPVQSPATKQNKKNMSSTTDTSTLGAKDGSLRRVLLVRDRKSNDPWRYGFAEFNTVDDAQAAMAKFNASDRFTISSKPVLLSYIHAGVFVPVLNAIAPEFERFTFSPLSNSAMKLMYWDEAAYTSGLVIAATPPIGLNSKRNDYDRSAAAAAHEGLLPAVREREPKTKKRKVEKDASISNKKVVAPHLQFWTNRHAELHGLPPKDDPGNDKTASEIEKGGQEAPPQTFADLERKCCLLCSRQFKTEAEVNKHERVSQLHRDNMKDEGLVAKALAKLTNNSNAGQDNSNYRDRAKERRTAFNQPKQPAPQQHKRTKEQSALEVVAEPPPPSKGAALLGKMGWTAGEGLGAQGTGRTEAIKTDIYSQGVGLGALGGKLGDAVEEADRQTKGTYKDFLNKTKDKAKERFQSMK